MKHNYVGAPKCFLLDMACREINDAFGHFGCYQVGSSLERADYRDVDIRFIMEDEKFKLLFPDAGLNNFQHDMRWLLLTTAISERMAQTTGLLIDFQFQPRSHANDRHKGKRYALGLIFARED